MSEKFKVFPATTILLGVLCFLWIVYDIVQIYFDLQSVLFFGTSGLIMGIGYLFILLFHILVLIIYFKYLRHHQNIILSFTLLSLTIISFLALAVEKVMFDEVGREFYLEFPAPGEVSFIYLGLFINALFIIYALYCINKGFKLIRIRKSPA